LPLQQTKEADFPNKRLIGTFRLNQQIDIAAALVVVQTGTKQGYLRAGSRMLPGQRFV
jgi:hypothetical protein